MVWLCCIDEFCDKAPRVTPAIPTCQDRCPCRIASPGECVDGLPGSPVVTEQGMCPRASLLRPGYRKTVASTLAAPPCPPLHPKPLIPPFESLTLEESQLPGCVPSYREAILQGRW